jgi:molybdate transport system regulatory protein
VSADFASADAAPLLGRLSLSTAGGLLAGESRIRLLEAVDANGSITRAARALPMSYKAAWDAIDAMNNLSEQALVERSTGGRQGGGTRLTDAGRRLIATYRALEHAQQGALAHLRPHLRQPPAPRGAGAAPGAAAPAVPDAAQLQLLLRRLAVRTSARNQFVGRVSRLHEGKLSVEVIVELDAHTRIAAGVTRDSARSLGLALGSPVLALVKASSVLLGVGDGVVTSARNHLSGTVSRVIRGPISAEVTLAVGAGRSVTAGITRDSLDRLGLAKGKPACALFKASSVILVALD